jgi:hypothetical protein
MAYPVILRQSNEPLYNKMSHEVLKFRLKLGLGQKI